jgi:DNA mismatch repair ATPase MutL
VPSGLTVDCTIDKNGAKIQVTDDGSGMSLLAVGLACEILKNRTTT